MLILEVTKKLENELKVNTHNVIPMEEDKFYSWHADIFMYNRRKCIILMNDKTRYSMVLYGLKKEQFKNLQTVLTEAIIENFTVEGFDADDIDAYVQKLGYILYSKTNDRVCMDQMTDMEYITINSYFQQYLQEDNINQAELNKKINRTILGKWKYVYGIEGLKEEMGSMKVGIN
jgi:hypothetical protein